MKSVALALSLTLAVAAPAFAKPAPAIPAAIYTDPAPDKDFPTSMQVVHIPSGGVEINAIVYVASGKGPHATVVLCHGLPGNEKNLDLAQALRRAGYNVIAFNYRGSWGSPGEFRFAQNPDDAAAVLAYARDPANAEKLRIDPKRLVIMGHSMGGWVTSMTAEHDKQLMGAVLISAANMGGRGTIPRAELATRMTDNGLEALTASSGEIMADELIANSDRFDFTRDAAALSDTPLLVLSSDDGLQPVTDALVTAIGAKNKATKIHVATDHGWSNARIRLQSEIINWLATLK